jgi:hypothetical protein
VPGKNLIFELILTQVQNNARIRIYFIPKQIPVQQMFPKKMIKSANVHNSDVLMV